MTRSVLFSLFCSSFLLLFACQPEVKTTTDGAANRLSKKSIFYVQKYGATGDKSQKVTTFIQQAIDDCHEAGGGQVYFSPGDYLTGSIVLKSNVELHLEAGATIFSSRDTSDFPKELIVYKQNDSGKEGDGATPVLIYAKDAKNIAITGRGTIHGQAERVYEDLRKTDGFIKAETENARAAGIEMKMYYKIPPFVTMIFLENCQNVRVKDVSLVESEDWTLHFKWCSDVRVNGCYIESSMEAGVNADGIDIDGCQNVTVSDCIIRTGDDAIVLKSTSTFKKFRDCRNVTVTNCVLESTSTALKMGTESFGNFSQILFTNCTIRNTNRGLSIVVRDGAKVSQVVFSDIVIETDRKHFNWWGNGDPIWLVVKKRKENSKIGSIEDVVFDNISARGQGTSKIQGFPGQPQTIKNIRLRDVSLHMNYEDLNDKRTDHALAITDASDIFVKDLSVSWVNANEPQPKWGHALYANNVMNLRIAGFSGVAGKANLPAIMLENVKGGMVKEAYTKDGYQLIKMANSTGVKSM